jgi:hypothetical protein
MPTIRSAVPGAARTTETRANVYDIPRRLRQRPRDRNGYPIPYVVLIKADGLPDFRASEPARWMACVEGRRCQLCGQSLTAGGWFIGGPPCEQSRRFLDPPMHHECGQYALQVCPFLAIPKAHYSDIERRPVLPGRVQVYNGEKPDRFMFGHADGWNWMGMHAKDGTVPVIVAWPWTELHWWKDGQEVR